MDPVSASLVLGGLSAGAQGVAAYQTAQGQKERAEINAFIGRTRAIQTNTTAQEGLTNDLANLRAVLGANSQAPGVGTLEVSREMRRIRGREKRIGVGARMSEAEDSKMEARNAGRKGRASLYSGALKSAPYAYDLYQYRRGI